VTHYKDVRYETDGPVAVVTIDRPHRYNAFRGRTIEELIAAFRAGWADRGIRAVILTGAGDKAFCTGGDVKQRAETSDYGPTESGLFEIDGFHRLIREIPKPVIAAVNGLAIGGGHVFHAERWGLVNAVVPAAELMDDAHRWAQEIARMSPTAIRFLKHSFNSDTEHQAGLANMATAALDLFAVSPEGQEGACAFAEKRTPDFAGTAR
jgi:naphthoate synthase